MWWNLALRTIIGAENDESVFQFPDLLQPVVELPKNIVHLHHAIAIAGARRGFTRPLVRGIIVEVAAPGTVLQEERLFAALHPVKEGQTSVHPMLV